MKHYCTISFWLFLLSVGFPLHAQVPYADEIAVFAQQDSAAFPRPGMQLFIGSSSFRLWPNVERAFPGAYVVNRAFGGATLLDLEYHLSAVALRYQPAQVLIYCGENDLAASDTVTTPELLARFQRVFVLLRRSFPRIPIVFCSMKPSPSRWGLYTRYQEGNAAIRKFLRRKARTRYLDVSSILLDASGKPDGRYFLADSLHLNALGYAQWHKAFHPIIKTLNPNER